jgi:hypothetical protein
MADAVGDMEMLWLFMMVAQNMMVAVKLWRML